MHIDPPRDPPVDARWVGFRRLTPVGEALRRFLEVGGFGPVGVEEVPWDESYGRVLASDVISDVDVPGFHRAAMDGYAVRAEDTFGASPETPRKLRVVGRVAVGERPNFSIKPGEAAELATGSALPEGANAVLRVEYAKPVGGYILVYQAVPPWRDVNRAGCDVRRGEVALRRGRVLRAQDVGMLALIGRRSVQVYRRPRVGVLAVGSELVDAFTPVEVGTVVDVDRPMIELLIRDCGGLPVDYGIVGDDASEVSRRLGEALESCDMAVSTGGVSVGKADLVVDALRMLGARIVVHGVASRPGSPVALSILNGKPIISLPGPPAATLIAFHLFARPVIRHLAGVRTEVWPCVRARLSARVPSKLGYRDYVRVRLVVRDGVVLAEPLRVTGSGVLSTMTEAHGFIEVPEDREGLEEGEEVQVHLFSPHEPIGVA